MKKTGCAVRNIILTILFITITVFCTTQTVFSREADSVSAYSEQYFDALEKEYVKTIRGILEDNGYANSGVTMTDIIEDNGEREYTVAIHHKRLDRLSECEKTELLSQLEQVSFGQDDCMINCCFL